MLHEFLTERRAELIDLCRAKVAQRTAPQATPEELQHGIPLFLEQLIKTLRIEQTPDPMLSREVSGSEGGRIFEMSEVGEAASLHGRELLQQGYTMEQLVHDYGDLCQAITGLAFELQEPISIDEFRTLNRCLDNAIATAVTEFSYQRDQVVAHDQAQETNQRLGAFAHELRNHLNTATLALSLIRSGDVALSGATGAILDRSLVRLRNLVDHSLAEVRTTAGMPVQHQLFSLAHFIAEVKLSASLEAQVKESALSVFPVDPQLAVDADRDLLFSAVGNLLQNAFKFTHPGTRVTLNAYSVADRILIDIEDHCGGLPPGTAEKMFLPFTQSGEDRTGLGLGLSIAHRSVEANEGKLSVRDIPGSGCVFTIDLPRHLLPAPSGSSVPELLS
jgi:signal transduction histidine kinase